MDKCEKRSEIIINIYKKIEGFNMGIIKKLRDWNINRKQNDIKKEMELYGVSDNVL